MNSISLQQLCQYAEQHISALEEGEALSPSQRGLIELAVALSVTSLDGQAIKAAIDSAFDAGASVGQVQEIAALVSGLGTHSLMASATTIVALASERGLLDGDMVLDTGRQKLWNQYVGDDSFWDAFSYELPGFLKALLYLSPEMFVAFFTYCAVPWKSGQVSAQIKELAAMACDITPHHRFGPGFRIHLANAIKLKVGRLAIMEVIDIASKAPDPIGYS